MKELSTLIALTDSFAKLPGVGVKSAERMAYAVLEMKEADAEEFANAILNAKRLVHRCPNCGLYAEGPLCDICGDPHRDHFHGVFHVLGGTILPSKGMNADSLQIDRLLKRVDEEGIKEVILATNPTLEGETTALFVAKVLESKNIKVSRLAYGLPMGASLDYADSLTLEKALEGRKKL